MLAKGQYYSLNFLDDENRCSLLAAMYMLLCFFFTLYNSKGKWWQI